jgi:hypothetical protein
VAHHQPAVPDQHAGVDGAVLGVRTDDGGDVPVDVRGHDGDRGVVADVDPAAVGQQLQGRSIGEDAREVGLQACLVLRHRAVLQRQAGAITVEDASALGEPAPLIAGQRAVLRDGAVVQCQGTGEATEEASSVDPAAVGVGGEDTGHRIARDEGVPQRQVSQVVDAGSEGAGERAGSLRADRHVRPFPLGQLGGRFGAVVPDHAVDHGDLATEPPSGRREDLQPTPRRDPGVVDG